MLNVNSNRALVALVFALLVAVPARAHIFLTAENLNDALKEIQRSVRDLRQDDGEQPPDWYQLGVHAQELTELLNGEVRMHGMEQHALLRLAETRLEALEVNVFWSQQHKQYFYDGAAFRKYLEQAPNGPHAAESRYSLIEYDFYHADADDADSLRSSAARKRDLLERFPDFRAAARIGFYLGIDYRDLWRLCRDMGDSKCASRYLERARAQFAHLIEEYDNSDTAELAQRFLRRIDDEANPGAPQENP